MARGDRRAPRDINRIVWPAAQNYPQSNRLTRGAELSTSWRAQARHPINTEVVDGRPSPAMTMGVRVFSRCLEKVSRVLIVMAQLLRVTNRGTCAGIGGPDKLCHDDKGLSAGFQSP